VARAGDRSASVKAPARVLDVILADDGDVARVAMTAHLDVCASVAHPQGRGTDHG
jgi:hypothetical protein